MDINIADIIINSVSIILNFEHIIIIFPLHRLNRNAVSTIELDHIANYRNIIGNLLRKLYINFTIISDIRSLSHDIPYANFKSYAFVMPRIFRIISSIRNIWNNF